MKERRQNLHSIISKISGNVEQSSEADTQGPIITSVTGSSDEKSDQAVPEMKIADEQPKRPMTRMYAKEGAEHMRHAAAIQRINSILLDPDASPPLICELCSVAFLTKRELQLHVMCHGIHISGDLGEAKVHAVVHPHGEAPPLGTVVPNEVPPVGSGSNTSDAKDSLLGTPEGSVVVNNEVKIVDVLSLATATRGFKEPGSIWCSLCKCTVNKGHTCKVYQTSYHAEKSEEGFTCELCGRYYNQKRKLRTHLRNRHKGFRLQEDEGYMCWQCWQAFPEIKILEEHIVTVHGHESRRQNSTWRPFSQPSTLPMDEQVDEAISPEPGASPVLTAAEQQNLSLKRPSEDIPVHSPAKKPSSDINGVLSVAEVNGKVVVTDQPMTTNNSFHPQATHFTPINPNITPSNPVGVAVSTAEVAKKPEMSSDIILKGYPTLAPNVTAVFGNPRVLHDSETANAPEGATDPRKKTPGNQKQQCPHCAEKFCKKYMLQLHIQQAHGENMHCFFCSTSCATKEVLASHIKAAHTEEMKSGKCPICQCKCLGELHQHIVQYHYKDLLTRKAKDRVLSTCPICQQATTDAYHLRWHILREHRGLQLPRELQDCVSEDTGSESGSSVASDRRLSSEEPEKVSENTRGHKGTSEDTSGEKGTSEGNSDQENPKQDDIAIVFVSDKNLNSDWSNQKTNRVPQVSTSANGVPLTATSANHIAPMSTTANHIAPISTTANHIALISTTANHIAPMSTTANHIAPISTTANHIAPISTTANHIAPISTTVNENSSVECIKKAADSSDGVSPKVDQIKSNQSEVHSTTGQLEATVEEATKARYDYHSISEDTCVFCFKQLTKETLSSHLRTDHGWVDTFTCPVCSFKANKYLTIVEHFCQDHFHPTEEVALTQSDAKCLKCDIIFQDVSHLKKHSSALHSFQLPSEATYNTFKCRHCNIIFEKQFDAQKHFDVYHLFRIRFKCESCRMGFTAKHDFQEHVTCNHPELVKNFCPVCGLGFEVNTDLEEHVFEMHRRKAQFYCAQCGNEFADRFHVHMHIRSNCCVTWADSNFECLDCLTAFSTISELRIHCKQRSCKPGPVRLIQPR